MADVNSSKADLYVNQGTDWYTQVNLNYDDGTPVNITGYQFFGSIASSYYTANSAANLSLTITNAPAGQVLLGMNAATSANLQSGAYTYDVVMLDTQGNTTKIATGILTIVPGVTGVLNRLPVQSGTQNTTPWLPNANTPVDINNRG